MEPVVLVLVLVVVCFFCSLTDEAEETSSASVLVNARPACFVKIILLIPLLSLCEARGIMRWIKPHDLYRCRNLLLQSPFRGSRSSCKPCSFINERQLGVDTDFVSVASKARGHSHQKTKIIFFVGCFQTKNRMRSLSPCRDLAMSCGGPAQQYARICDRRLVTVLSLVPGLCCTAKR